MSQASCGPLPPHQSYPKLQPLSTILTASSQHLTARHEPHPIPHRLDPFRHPHRCHLGPHRHPLHHPFRQPRPRPSLFRPHPDSSSSRSFSSSSSMSSRSSSSSSASSFSPASASAFALSTSSWASFIFFSPSFVTSNNDVACSAATLGSSVMSRLSKIVPDLTCHRSKPILQFSAYLAIPAASSGLYSGLSISGCTQTPL